MSIMFYSADILRKNSLSGAQKRASLMFLRDSSEEVREELVYIGVFATKTS